MRVRSTYPLVQYYVRIEVVRGQILIIFGMQQINNIMVTDNLAVCFYFEVEIRFKLPNSFRNILVDNFITRSLMKILLYELLPAFSLTIIATFLLNFLYNLFFIFSQCVEEFYFRRLVRMELLFFIINDLLFLSWSV